MTTARTIGSKLLTVGGKVAISAKCCCKCPYGLILQAEFHIERVESGGCNWRWDFFDVDVAQTGARQWEIDGTDTAGGHVHVVITIPEDNPLGYHIVITNNNACDPDGQTFTELDHAWTGDGFNGFTGAGLKLLTTLDSATEQTYRLVLACRGSSSSS